MDFLDKFNIKIKNKKLLEDALTHTSYANEHNCGNYERLEFLGDAVLQLISSEYLYKNMPHAGEGELSKVRASFVCESALAKYSKEIGIDKCIRVGNSHHMPNDTIIADCFESVLGAIYLDQGFEVSKKYVLEILAPHFKHHDIFFDDYKSKLQEMTQTDKKTLEYNLVKESGPAHNKRFTMEVIIDGIVYGVGSGKSKKEAEQQAAKAALDKSVK